VEHGVEPGRLIFELTETSAMADPVASLDLLTRLRMKGFRLSSAGCSSATPRAGR
jgi:EAL domain-containing protein (putative c-di-GMP-specific phosphodiesterase class I)